VSGSTSTPLYIDTSNTQAFERFSINGTSKGFIGYAAAGTSGLSFLNAAGSTVNLLVTDTGFVGIGTTSPQAKLDVYGGTFLASRGGSSPSISSCGTSPTVTGTNNSMVLTMGSGTLTTCSVTFNPTWSVAPNSCSLTPANATAAQWGITGAYVSGSTTTTLTMTGTNLTNATYNIHCM
jgi:hypothetical protein